MNKETIKLIYKVAFVAGVNYALQGKEISEKFEEKMEEIAEEEVGSILEK